MGELTLESFGVQELDTEQMYQNGGGFGNDGVLSLKTIHEWGDFTRGFLDGLFN